MARTWVAAPSQAVIYVLILSDSPVSWSRSFSLYPPLTPDSLPSQRPSFSPVFPQATALLTTNCYNLLPFTQLLISTLFKFWPQPLHLPLPSLDLLGDTFIYEEELLGGSICAKLKSLSFQQQCSNPLCPDSWLQTAFSPSSHLLTPASQTAPPLSGGASQHQSPGLENQPPPLYQN